MISRKTWQKSLIGLLVIGDLISYILALQLITSDFIRAFQNPLIIVYTTAIGFAFIMSGLYKPNGTVSRVDEATQLIRIIGILTVGGILVGVLPEITPSIGLLGLVQLALVFGGLAIAYRWLFRTIQKYLFRFNWGTRRTLIVGVNRHSEEVCQKITTHPRLGYDPVGFVCDVSPVTDKVTPLPVVGNVQELPRLICDLQIDDVIIALYKPEHESLLQLISTINGQPVEIKILPDMYEAVTGLARTENIYGLPLIRINPDFITRYQAFAKRTVDMLVSSTGLLIMAPLMLVIGVIVRLTSPGPAIFFQHRLGFRGKRFTIRKFRTMIKDAEKVTGPVWAKTDDPRITPFGRFLRRSRLDELPQLWNVLIGNMSLVGPRPERPELVEQLMGEFPYYYRRMLVRPGMTGWAQIRGKYDTSIEDVRQKLKDDFFYIENLSAKLDLKILLMTVWVVLSGKGH